MQLKVWSAYAFIILSSVVTFGLLELGDRARLPGFVQEALYVRARRIQAQFTDFKFRLRGNEVPKHKVVVVEIDSPSIDRFGRWPWPRHLMAVLVDSLFAQGARAVGLDMVFSEEQQSVPKELRDLLKENGHDEILRPFDYDARLAVSFLMNANKLALAWVTEAPCRPGVAGEDVCPVSNKDAIDSLPKNFGKFAIETTGAPKLAHDFKLVSAPFLIANLDSFNGVARHSGFANGFRESDGVIRRTSLVMAVDGKLHPSLPLALYEITTNQKIKAEMTPDGSLRRLVDGSGRELPVNEAGLLGINFRGPERTFPYLSASDVLMASDKTADKETRSLASGAQVDLSVLKDATVLVGVSALALSDLAATPYTQVMPGVEVHATVVDNLLSRESIDTPAYSWTIVLVVMILGAVVYLRWLEKLDARPALALAIAIAGALAVTDVLVLFGRHQDWNIGLVYVELSLLTAAGLVAKYLREERDRKFLRGAFSKYVSPAVVDSLVKSRELALGGRKETLTVLFSDMRGFTNFSETMDAKLLSEFLIEYNTIMTDIIFQHGGTLDKYIGDAIMAFWGAPISQKEHALNACKAAVAMTKALDENAPKFKEKYGVNVNIGIGLHSGTMSVGNMGSVRSFGYTVIGDNVNLASRLEGVTKFFGVRTITTKFTLEEVTAAGLPLPRHRPLAAVKVKGKKQAVEIVELLGETFPMEKLDAFEKGKELFKKCEWDAAIAVFEEASKMLAMNGELDGPCLAYIEKIKVLKTEPPEKGWDGSWSLPKG